MLKRFSKVLLFIFLIYVDCCGQETASGPGYQSLMMNNPALAGVEGDGVLRLSYLNFYPGNNYNLHSVYCSYDSYFPSLHGGAGFYLSNDYLGGLVNDLRGGVSYAYFLQASEDLFINAGLSASVYHRGYNFDQAILPDQIDPLGGVSIPSSEILSTTGQTVFDLGAGFIFISGKLFGGVSINHLTEPNFSESGFSEERLRRKIIAHLSSDFLISKNRNLRIRPVSILTLQSRFLAAGAGVVLESNNLSVNTILLRNAGKDFNIQTGFALNAGKVSFYYNYRFNIISGNNLLPLSLLHQTGLAFILYHVDKRNIIKTIKFPKL